MNSKKVLLHICCGVCAGGVVEGLRQDGFEVTGFFYNPNIYPPQEYQKRLEAARQIADYFKFELIEGIYDPARWADLTAGFENEPEGGKRCEVCYKIRLEKTFELGFDYFTTTLTVSPHKKALTVNRIGEELSREKFLARDFKKNDGFKKAIERAKELNLYRQRWCGCRWSRLAAGIADDENNSQRGAEGIMK